MPRARRGNSSTVGDAASGKHFRAMENTEHTLPPGFPPVKADKLRAFLLSQDAELGRGQSRESRRGRDLPLRRHSQPFKAVSLRQEDHVVGHVLDIMIGHHHASARTLLRSTLAAVAKARQ